MENFLIYYCRYNLWANEKLAHFFANKSDDLLTQPIENSFPSIKKTVLHILSAERTWLSRLGNTAFKNERVADEFPTTLAAFEALVATSKAFLQYVEKQDNTFLEREMNYHTWDGNAWTMAPKIMVHHCMNHSTYHRGQLITMARQLGMKEGVPSTDLLYYSRTV